MVNYAREIKIECEKEDDGDIIFVEIVKAIKILSNEGRLKGTIKYG